MRTTWFASVKVPQSVHISEAAASSQTVSPPHSVQPIWIEGESRSKGFDQRLGSGGGGAGGPEARVAVKAPDRVGIMPV